jgi:4'-phosphopantetheinyl transferase
MRNRLSLSAKTIPMVRSDEVHLWVSYDEQIRDVPLLNRYHSLMNQSERMQQKRFYFAKHRHQYLITRALMRSVLSLYVDEIDPKSWKFTKNEYGKPYIKNAPMKLPLHFNLSHTEKAAVLAVTVNREVGVDVEYLCRKGKTVELAESYFSPAEVQQLLILPKAKQKERFFELWTLKEAYIKACGMGLSIPLSHFSYHFSRKGDISISFAIERNDQPERWRFWHLCLNDTHKVSVALKNDDMKVPYSLSMREITPLSDIKMVNYPIVMKSPLAL